MQRQSQRQEKEKVGAWLRAMMLRVKKQEQDAGEFMDNGEMDGRQSQSNDEDPTSRTWQGIPLIPCPAMLGVSFLES